MALPPDSQRRFSGRVEDYVRFRPRYPRALVPILREEIGLESHWTVADVGSGTGFSAEPFLDNGNPVFAIEPNAEMRHAAEAWLGVRKQFRSVAGSAEATGLNDASVDLVVAGQAFHWFDRVEARKEFLRILRPPKWVALFWNTRLLSGSPFDEGYESLLTRFGTDYDAVRHDRMDRDILAPFFGGRFTRRTIPSEQRFDYEGLEGRLRSSSYTPPPDHPNYASMLTALRELFDDHQVDGTVLMPYETEIYAGQLGRAFGNVWPTEL